METDFQTRAAPCYSQAIHRTWNDGRYRLPMRTLIHPRKTISPGTGPARLA